MSEPTDTDAGLADTERELRELMRARVGALTPPVAVYAAVRSRRRRATRRALVAAAMAVSAVLASIPVGYRLLAAPTTRSRPPATDSGDPAVRGSLAGDSRLLAEALLVARQDLSSRPDGLRPALDPATIRPIYAEQSDGTVIVLVVGEQPGQDWIELGVLGRGPGASTLQVLGWDGGLGQAGDDGYIRLGEQYAEPSWIVRGVTIAGRSFGVVIVPPEARAALVRNLTLTASCLIQGQDEPIRLTDGTALFPVPAGETTRVRVVDGAGQQRIDLELAHHRPTSVTPPSDTQLNAAIDGARGQVADRDAVVQAFKAGLLYYGNQPQSYAVLWAGRLPGSQRPAALLAERLAGGVSYVSEVNTLSPGQYGSDLGGCLPDPDPARRVLAWRIGGHDDAPLVVVAPPQAVRATVGFTDGASAPLPLAEGIGILPRAGRVGVVQAYDAAGNLLDQRPPGGGLIKPSPF
jgi:hypothetical protein